MEQQTWTKLCIDGRLMVSDFGRVHCTDDFSIEYPREEVVPGKFLNTPPDYDGVYVEALEGENVNVKIGSRSMVIAPGKWHMGPQHPLSYAWSTICVALK